ncbi:SIMPL domain-containing protein [Candidatus Gracilibacteria bacterium]|nr:SIMPL domain-containing protein [Candidatus Gracilibacteria bacterium]MCF7819603.1 SIMPL domain-containing protein [Candidatus Gracilibacteria bacterium]
MQKNISLVVSVAIICLTVLGVAYALSQTDIAIKNTGTVSGSVQNSISVSGEGKVMARPDIVRVNIGVSELGQTTKEAQDTANRKLNQILSILEEHDVSEKNIQTTNLSFSPEYEWQKDNGRELVGQRVRQTVNVKVEDINRDADRVTNILDALGTIDGIEMNSVQFDIEEKEVLFSEAREKAFEKAEQKAKELAKLGDVKLLKPITISESTINYHPPMLRNYAMAEMAADGMGGGSSLPSGELEVTANVSVVFGIE